MPDEEKITDPSVIKVDENSDLYPYLVEAMERYRMDYSRTVPKNIRGKKVSFYLKIIK
jgi:hypothetical protein